MAALTITSAMQTVLERAMNSENTLSLSEKAAAESCLADGELKVHNIGLLKKCLQAVNASGGANMSLLECLKGSQAGFARSDKGKGKKTDTSPDAEAARRQRREFLQLEREKREYNRMVFGSEV